MDSQNKNPDELLTGINKSILTIGIIVAIVIHAVIIFGTSFGLYKDWNEYGFGKKPSTIKAEKKAKEVAAEKARREAEIQRKAAAAAEVEKNATQVSEETKKTVDAAGEATADKPADGSATKTPPEIEPLPRATTDDIGMDDLGINLSL